MSSVLCCFQRLKNGNNCNNAEILIWQFEIIFETSFKTFLREILKLFHFILIRNKTKLWQDRCFEERRLHPWAHRGSGRAGILGSRREARWTSKWDATPGWRGAQAMWTEQLKNCRGIRWQSLNPVQREWGISSCRGGSGERVHVCSRVFYSCPW